MAPTTTPKLSEDEIDDLIYFARAGEVDELTTLTNQITSREECKMSDLLAVATDEFTGNGVLHMAAANGHLAAVNAVIAALSKPTPQNPAQLESINAQNKAGNTALHYAAVTGSLECVKVLIEAGADPTITNSAGHDSIYEAEINDRKEIVEWVLRESEDVEKGVAGDQGDEDGAEDDEVEDVAEDVEVMDINDLKNLASSSKSS